MSIRHLKTLVAIADKGSFIEAAEAVFVTQAAVSMQMKTLETDLNMQLFDRTRRPPTLNEAGMAIVPKAREIVRHYEQFMETPAMMDKLSGQLSLGSVPTMLTGVLPTALASLRSSLPQLHISVSSALSSSLITQVDRGAIDAAIISEPPSERPGLLWSPFGIEPLIVIAPIDSPNESAEWLLENNPFIRYSKAAWVGQMIDKYLQEAGIVVNDTMELNTLESIATMVYHGLGVSIIPQRNIQYPGSLSLKRVPFTNKAPHRILGLIEKENGNKSHLTKELIAELALAMGKNRL
ncbi:LysR family transcriptional regulator [Amphritea sp. 2_MG-2023]|uniref:LysR family transcriptional regulator n=1 Tax=Amphritea TaxID=515417 RepID=UPI001C06D043|nr:MULTISPECIES: LysR family transcriptional regulator [Amphritea]MBU2966766.1 LysR family transcriptional regulator [Amphritea atlantica]MDO6418967.1 LysR family transcriptional regulator [Amphritea sp. 2_MG-2023]